MPAPETPPDTIEAPPFLRTWPNVYAAVLVGLAALLIVLYVLTQWFRY
jgi:Tfp pilus assembly protein PilN